MRRRVLAVLAAVMASAGTAGPAFAQELRPRAHITGGPEAQTTSTTSTFTFEATGPTPLGAGFECRLDGGPWVGCASPRTVSGLVGGPHSFEVRLTGTLTDGTPDKWNWVVQQQTIIAPGSSSGGGGGGSGGGGSGGGTGGGAGTPGGSVNPVPEPAIPPPPPPARPDRARHHGGCRYAGNEPGEVRAALLRRATLCLIDRERRRRGLRPVRRNPSLERAAALQVRDMLRRRYFDHVSPSGRGPGERAALVGYLRSAQSWTVGEVLAWLIRPRPTPGSIVRAWMRSRPHRTVLLQPSFRDFGVYFARGNPRTTAGGATWAALFGRVSRRPPAR